MTSLTAKREMERLWPAHGARHAESNACAFWLLRQQTQRIDARGFRRTYGYDALDRVTKRRYPNATRATFAYDAVGNRARNHSRPGIWSIIKRGKLRYRVDDRDVF